MWTENKSILFREYQQHKNAQRWARCTAPVSDHVYAHQFYMLGSLLAICDVRIFTYYTILVSQCSLAPANVMCNTNYFMALSKKKKHKENHFDSCLVWQRMRNDHAKESEEKKNSQPGSGPWSIHMPGHQWQTINQSTKFDCAFCTPIS